MGGRRAKKNAEKAKFEEASIALSRPAKDVPERPDEMSKEKLMKQGVFATQEDDSDDLEEESSEHDEEKQVEVSEPVKSINIGRELQKQPRPDSVQFVNIETLMEEIEEEEQERQGTNQEEEEKQEEQEQQQQQEQEQEQEQEQKEEEETKTHLLDSESKNDSNDDELSNENDLENEAEALPECELAPENGETAMNESVLDWEGVELELAYELGEGKQTNALRSRFIIQSFNSHHSFPFLKNTTNKQRRNWIASSRDHRASCSKCCLSKNSAQ